MFDTEAEEIESRSATSLVEAAPSHFMLLSPVRAPPASFIRPLALSDLPSFLSSLSLLVGTGGMLLAVLDPPHLPGGELVTVTGEGTRRVPSRVPQELWVRRRLPCQVPQYAFAHNLLPNMWALYSGSVYRSPGAFRIDNRIRNVERQNGKHTNKKPRTLTPLRECQMLGTGC